MTSHIRAPPDLAVLDAGHGSSGIYARVAKRSRHRRHGIRPLAQPDADSRAPNQKPALS